MKKSFLFFVCFLFALIQLHAQKKTTYWKDKKPFEGYWQQDVDYTIHANINDSLDVIDGKLKLIYSNNSPDSLSKLYFHLFSNAFQPNSYYHKLWEANNRKPKFGEKYEINSLGNSVENIKVNQQIVDFKIENTILEITLNKAIKPNSSATIEMDFKTYYDQGDMRRRMKMYVDKWGNKHFDGVHWYPSIAVYDRKFGWTTDQHLDKEFYHDFGTFNVFLTFPQHYILDATGILINQNEVLPIDLRNKLDMANFKDKPFDSEPSIIIPKEKNKSKTWHFQAHNVHNFAFTADPTYRIDEVKWNGISCVALAQESHASKWQHSAEFLSKIIEYYSTEFGMYEWPKIIVSDANDGMEYPMLTLDGGIYPQHQGLFAHEVGHMWFYGMLGNNETYRPNMDEGFTQFLTVHFLDKLNEPNKSLSLDKVGLEFNRYLKLYYPYLKAVWDGRDNALNTHASDYNSGIRHEGGYGLVYYKHGVMLYNLQYVLGKDLFKDAMQYYVDKWKFCHPYPEDFRNTIIEYTKTDLNWFFDQWLETTKHIDYGILSVNQTKKTFDYQITFKRYGKMQMPIDFIVTTKNGDTSFYHIPNTWFIKKTKATVLPMWYGWDKLQQEYTATIQLNDALENIIIDPTRTMADVNLTDNSFTNNELFKFDLLKPDFPRWDKKQHFIRPSVWYNNLDGLQIGIQSRKFYFDNKFSYESKILFNSTLLQSTEIAENSANKNLPLSFYIKSNQNLNNISLDLSKQNWFAFNAGLMNFGVGFEKLFKEQDTRNKNYFKLSINTKYLLKSMNKNHIYYRNQPNLWGLPHDVVYVNDDETVKTVAIEEQLNAINSKKFDSPNINGSINFGIEQHYAELNHSGFTALRLRTPGAFSDYNYSYLELEINHSTLFYKNKLELRARLFGRLGSQQTPYESALYLSSANPESQFDNIFTQASGFVPSQWLGYGEQLNHFHQGGGLMLRGYSGYLAPEIINDTMYFSYVGNTGGSFSMELDFDKLIKFQPKKLKKYLHLDTYFFTDLGMMQINTFSKTTTNYSKLRVDAGMGLACTINFANTNLQPIVIRFDVPFYLNSAPETSNSTIDFNRFVVGIGRSF